MHVSTVRDFSFLDEMPSLRVVDILSNVIDDDGLRNFVVPENLKVLTLYVSGKSVSEPPLNASRIRRQMDAKSQSIGINLTNITNVVGGSKSR